MLAMRPLAGLFLILLVAACAQPATLAGFLADNVNKITQEELLKAWGAPESTRQAGDGATVVVYKYFRKGSPPRVAMPPAADGAYGGGVAGAFPRRQQPELIPGTPDICRLYTLTFDRSGVLRRHEESAC